MARIVLSSRELGRPYHGAGVDRLVRNDLFRGKTPQDFYRRLDWIYGHGRALPPAHNPISPVQ